MNSLQPEIIQSHHPTSSEPQNPFLEKYKNKLILDVEQDIILSKPQISFSDIAGQEHAKRVLQEHIILPCRFPQLFVGRYCPSSAIWLYGPSGTGKRLLIQACANEIDAPFFVLEAQDLLQRGPKRATKKLKKTFEAAKTTAPSIIYIDDPISLFPGTYENSTEDWRRFKTEYLLEAHELRKSFVAILATSQKPWLMQPHVRRRLPRRIYCSLPVESARKELITKQLNSIGVTSLSLEDQEYLVKETQGFSGAEIREIVRRACYEPMREAQRTKTFKICGELSNGVPVYQACDKADPEAKKMSLLDIPAEQLKLRNVLREDFERVWNQIQPSVDEFEISKYEEFRQEFGEE